MASTQAERITALERDVLLIQDRMDVAARGREEWTADLKEHKDTTVSELKAHTTDLSALRQEIALLRQRLDDHIKRVEVWEGRRWGLLMLMAGATLSLASGLIVTLARK